MHARRSLRHRVPSTLGVLALASGLVLAVPCFLSAGRLLGVSQPVSLQRIRPAKSWHGAALAAAGCEASAAELAECELWLDFRAGRYRPPEFNIFASGQLTECPRVKEEILKLVDELKASFKKIGAQPPSGNFVDGIILDEVFANEAVDRMKELKLPVYVASKDIEGDKLPGSAYYVCTVDNGTLRPFACLLAREIRISAVMRQSPQEVWTLEPEDSAEKAANEKEKEEYMKRYLEGLEDTSKYIMPPRERLRELVGVQTEKVGADLALAKGKLLAKSLPPDARLWGQALMLRLKAAGGTVGYTLKRDGKDKA